MSKHLDRFWRRSQNLMSNRPATVAIEDRWIAQANVKRPCRFLVLDFCLVHQHESQRIALSSFRENFKLEIISSRSGLLSECFSSDSKLTRCNSNFHEAGTNQAKNPLSVWVGILKFNNKICIIRIKMSAQRLYDYTHFPPCNNLLLPFSASVWVRTYGYRRDGNSWEAKSEENEKIHFGKWIPWQ